MGDVRLTEGERLIVGRAHDSGTWNDVLAGIEAILTARLAAVEDPMFEALDLHHDSAYHVHAAECCWPFAGVSLAIRAALTAAQPPASEAGDGAGGGS